MPVTYGSEEFNARAEECARLADMTKDDMVQTELLQLRQIYLQTAERLKLQRKAE